MPEENADGTTYTSTPEGLPPLLKNLTGFCVITARMFFYAFFSPSHLLTPSIS